MKGAYRVVVETKKIKYDFQIKRNITINEKRIKNMIYEIE